MSITVIFLYCLYIFFWLKVPKNKLEESKKTCVCGRRWRECGLQNVAGNANGNKKNAKGRGERMMIKKTDPPNRPAYS